MFLILFIRAQSLVTLAQDFMSNSFVDMYWNVQGTVGVDDKFLFSDCSERIAGGYQKFTGHPDLPTLLYKQFTNLPIHWSIGIKARLYKIDGWDNQIMSIIVDGTQSQNLTWSDSSFPSDLCGDPSKNDGYQDINLNYSHSGTTLRIQFKALADQINQYWGIRNIQIFVDPCHGSCLTCDGPDQNDCLACPAVTDLLQLFEPDNDHRKCSCFNDKRQYTTPCYGVSCFTCQSTCNLIHFQKDSQCKQCPQFCEDCSGQANIPSDCTKCQSQYIQQNPYNSGDKCQSCHTDCLTCNDITDTSCTSCPSPRFLIISNNSCALNCPNRFCHLEQTKTCVQCHSSCKQCWGGGQDKCLSCEVGQYLQQDFKCDSSCTPNFIYTNNNTCLSVCPLTTYANTSSYLCQPCISNCVQCGNNTHCIRCNQNTFLHQGQCLSNCKTPISLYQDTTDRICRRCYWNCMVCSGGSKDQCTQCVTGYQLVGTECSRICPSGTYSSPPDCLPCPEQCTSCSSQSVCTSCAISYFLHLNTSTCIKDCSPKNELDFTCWDCKQGQYNQGDRCSVCFYGCIHCESQFWDSCLKCQNSRQLYLGTCLCKDKTEQINKSCYESDSTASIYSIVIVTSGIGIVLSLFLELLFNNRTILLPFLQYLQLTSLFIYISIPLPYNFRQVLSLLYNSQLSTLVPPILFNHSMSGSTMKYQFQENNKTGILLVDIFNVLIIYIILIGVVLILLLMRWLFNRYSCTYLYHLVWLINKLLPHAFVIFTYLLIIELTVSLTISFRNFNFSDALNGFSNILGIILISILVFGMVISQKIDQWFRSEEIQHKKPQEQSFLEEASTGTFYPLISKMPLAIMFPLLKGYPLSQSTVSLFIVLLVGCSNFFIPYKRLIYKISTLLMYLSLALFILGFILYTSGGYDEGIMFSASILCITTFLFLITQIFQFISNISFICKMMKGFPGKWSRLRELVMYK